MKRHETQSIRLKQLTKTLAPTQAIREVTRPSSGWIRAIRQALGLSLQSVADQIKSTPQGIHDFEKREAKGTITLRQLEAVASGMGCRLVYTLVPLTGTLAELARTTDDQTLREVRHTMALEGQPVDEPPAS
jgi:predicted DNA-binding mobile mystery protein A